MLYWLLYPLSKHVGVFNVFKYITFRSFGAAITGIVLSMIIGPWFIRKMREKQIGQSIRADGPQSHLSKKGTPTMGGAMILGAIAISTLLWADLGNRHVWTVLFVTFATGVIGWIDDWRKIVQKNSKGVSGRQKLFWQGLIALAAGAFIYFHPEANSEQGVLTFPFFKDLAINLKLLYIPFAMIVIVGASNAVNLTDGLDGLAIGPIIITATTYAVLSYLAGNSKIAGYLQIPYIPGTGELTVFCAAMAAAGLGFLWFNAYPAEVFMGDVGSLPLGAAIGTVAVLTKNEILLALVGGIFVLEAVSVMMQVFSFKTTGKRIFKMAPIHHHFELKGWPEPKVIVRFWIISILLAIMALSTLKLR
ncbi:MAG: phospho-N-acetylmuramoyl-pentapeptide-transferase [Deltaproteobacteria bacterium]|nr:phospho-N-acetylmuramoyl-pentapeptide-transferase [Deltaproteobacteria bacterium]